jgi:hypothetical protein
MVLLGVEGKEWRDMVFRRLTSVLATNGKPAQIADAFFEGIEIASSEMIMRAPQQRLICGARNPHGGRFHKLT